MTQAQTISTRKHAYSPHPIMAGNRETFDRPKDIEASNCTADPNPASDWVSFNYTLPDSEVEGFIKISDVNGKVIKTLTLSGMHGQKVWDTRKTDAGIYFYTFKVNGISKSGKVIISK
ncbi:MAG: T9SS type A sorting domain-containing protein [Bacteroidales bacterium]|jgi:hypothetical protein|nr:T9SS type A sorting domain-containing protein [Bacteroidales bacterium]MDD3526036.1 T9SS type A sorting domain-containing protein [Bacteroidales bacterium]MDY0335963.1 T9SS type A sorting domain-containing protein [Bacteroidales bacterium]